MAYQGSAVNPNSPDATSDANGPIASPDPYGQGTVGNNVDYLRGYGQSNPDAINALINLQNSVGIGAPQTVFQQPTQPSASAAPPAGPPPAGVSAAGTPFSVQSFGNPMQFAQDLLHNLNDPETAANIASLVNWQRMEAAYGSGGVDDPLRTHNPLNTTQPGFGGISLNGIGIKQYPDWASGLNATVDVLRNGLYNDILQALAGGGGLGSGRYQGLGTWSGGGYYSI